MPIEGIKPRVGRPLTANKDFTLAAIRPWEAAGKSRSTYFRRIKREKAAQTGEHREPAGDEITSDQANYNPLEGGKTGQYRARTLAVDSFAPNPWGLYPVHGDVWEWCEDQYDASSHALRGGSWDYFGGNLGSADRIRSPPDNRSDSVGFRVARTL